MTMRYFFVNLETELIGDFYLSLSSYLVSLIFFPFVVAASIVKVVLLGFVDDVIDAVIK